MLFRLAEVNLLLHEYKAATFAAREGQKSLQLVENYMDLKKLEQSLFDVLLKVDAQERNKYK